MSLNIDYYFKVICSLLFLLFIIAIGGCREKNELLIKESNNNLGIKSKSTQESRPLTVQTNNNTININPEDDFIIVWNNIGEPAQFPDKNGNPDGFQAEVAESIMKEMGQKYRWVREDNQELLNLKIKLGQVHACIPVIITKERMKIYKFAQIQDIITCHIWVHKDNNTIGGNSFDDIIPTLFNKTVGVIHGSNVYEYLREYNQINFKFYIHNLDVWPPLVTKEIDAVLAVDNVAWKQKEKYIYPIKPVGSPMLQIPYATCFHKSIDQNFINRYNRALTKIKDNGKYLALKEKWSINF